MGPGEWVYLRQRLPPDHESLFPNLPDSGYFKTSDASWSYNCIAWAAGVTDRWWDPAPGYYWPAAAPRQFTVEAFLAAFETAGYVQCDSGKLEPGVEKIALYATDNRVPQHAARQLGDGSWTSKLGTLEDIAHPSIDNVAGSDYGSVVAFMMRPITTS